MKDESSIDYNHFSAIYTKALPLCEISRDSMRMNSSDQMLKLCESIREKVIITLAIEVLQPWDFLK